MTTKTDTIMIRRATAGDAPHLERLAGRDYQRLPGDEFLIAEVAGEPWAAVGIHTGALVADPFRPSAEVAEMVRRRAETLSGGDARHAGRGQVRHLATA